MSGRLVARALGDSGTAERALNGLVGASQVKKFATDVMKTKDVRLDVKLNKAIWGKGVRNVSGLSSCFSLHRTRVSDVVLI